MEKDRIIHCLDSIEKSVSSVGAMIGAVSIFLMTLLITIDVLGRTIGIPTRISVEVSGYFLIAIVFLGLAYTQKNEKNIQISLLISKLSYVWRKLLGIATLILATVFIGWLTIITFENAMRAYSMDAISQTALHTPLWIPYMLVPIGLGMLAVVLVIELVKTSISK